MCPILLLFLNRTASRFLEVCFFEIGYSYFEAAIRAVVTLVSGLNAALETQPELCWGESACCTISGFRRVTIED